MITIRNEAPADHVGIRTLTVGAFGNSEFGHNSEAELIDGLRSRSVHQLSLVACSGAEIVGHILFTPVTIRTSEKGIGGVGLAPMSVAPLHQRMGVGSLLINTGVDRLFEEQCPFCVVLGHPDYYTRFGFLPAMQYAISHGFAGIPQDVFFIRFNPTVKLEQMPGGRAYYDTEFGDQHIGT
ncbi:MAG: N-acetyltransferase [Planctomycetota bacterium]